MKVPPLLIGVALLFWGEETDNLIIGVLLCLLLEGGNLIKTRYQLDEEDFIKISDVTSLVFLASVALVLLNFEPINFLRLTAGWLPLSLSPLITAQLYSTGDTVVIGTRLGKKKAHTYKPLDFRFYYLTICIFAAATGNSRSLWFYPVLAGILAWFLFENRGRSFSPIHFLLLFAVSLGGGYATIRGIEFARQQVLERAHGFWHGYYREKFSDPFKAHVNFGEIGRLKISGEIIMRVSASESPPALFKEASYTTFTRGMWLGKQDFVFLAPVDDGRWDLIDAPHQEEGKMVSVQYNLPKEKGLLPYPQWGYRLQSKTIFEIEQNKSGVVKVIDGAPIISYDLWYQPAIQSTTDLPNARNLAIPDNEKYVLQAVVQKIEESEDRGVDSISSLKKYFQKDFQYSLNFLGKEEYDTPLGNFLLKRKSGFCEYYATATTLLLRSFGIPSRYAVGFAVNEKSRLEGKYVVRKRHAHAWAEAFVDNKWIVVDTTPANWLERDGEQAPFYQGIQDLFNFIRHHYRLFRIGTGAENTLRYSIIVIVLTSFLVLRIYRRLKIEKAEREKKTIKLRAFASITSPFTQVMEIIMQSHVDRKESERFVDWAARMYPGSTLNPLEFNELYGLHLRMRFDPKGLTIAETERLRHGSAKILEEIKSVEA